jgi:hypothetical protein
MIKQGITFTSRKQYCEVSSLDSSHSFIHAKLPLRSADKGGMWFLCGSCVV